MKIRMKVDGEDVCQLEVWEDKVPRTAAAIRNVLPLTTTLQHGKLTGDLLLMQTAIVEAWENPFYPDEEFSQGRIKEKGKIGGALSFYPPRQQISIIYGEDLPSEPLPVSAIGEVIEGLDKVIAVGNACWFDPGQLVELSLA